MEHYATKSGRFCRSQQRISGRLGVLAVGACALLVSAFLATPSLAGGPCQRSAVQAHLACSYDVRDDLWEAKAVCTHIAADEEREECFEEAQEDRGESWQECRDKLEARLDFCAETGEDRYDPDFDPKMFTDIFDNANPYWLLAPGNHWEFEGDGETIVVNVLAATKRIADVDCIVVNDVVSDEEGQLIEDTDDWYGQALSGDVYYCGENAKDYEYFDGDDPEVAELVAIDGSFKHGVEGAKAGIVMWANPQVGDIYRQEFSLGNAEDVAEVLSTTYGYGVGGELDQDVPQELVELFCDGDCVVTREWNLIEPGAAALKYYAPGVGVFLEVEDGEVVELVACNVDARCDEL